MTANSEIPEPLHGEIGWKVGIPAGENMWIMESRGYLFWGHKIQFVLEDCFPSIEVLHLSSHKLVEMEKKPDIFEIYTSMEVEIDNWGRRIVRPFVYRPRNYGEFSGVEHPYDVIMLGGKFIYSKPDSNNDVSIEGNVLKISFNENSIHYNIFDTNVEYFSMSGFIDAFIETVAMCEKEKLK